MSSIVDILKYIITGDNTGLKQAAKESDAAIAKMTENVGQSLRRVIFQMVGFGSAAAGAALLLRSSFRAALEAESAIKELETTLTANGISWQKNSQRIKEFLAQLQATTGFADEEFLRALKTMIQAGMGLEQALSLLPVAANIAAANVQNTLAPAADALAQAFNGVGRSLRSLNIFVPESIQNFEILDKATEFVQRRFGDASQKSLQGYSGELRKLAVAFDELKESIGEFLLNLTAPLIGLKQLLDSIVQSDFFTKFLNLFAPPGVTFEPFKKSQFFDLGVIGQQSKTNPITVSAQSAIVQAEKDRLKLRQKTLAELSKLEDENVARTVQAQTDGLNKIIEAEQKHFEFRRQLGQDTYQEEIDFLEKIKTSAEAMGLFDLADEMAAKIKNANQSWLVDLKAKGRDGFNALINASHQLAFEFSRGMSEAVSNFVHNAIQGISDIRANVNLIQASKGGIGSVAGGLGIFGSVVGIISSFADAIFGGSEKIFKSNVEVVRAIQNWITSLRGQTREELVAGRKDIEDTRKALAEFRALDKDFLKQNSDEFVKSLGDSEFKSTFAAAAEQFKRSTGRRGSVEEVLFFMEQQLKKQERLFDALVGGKVKSPDDVRKLLSEQTRLDAQTGRQWIEFIARQNNWTPAEQKALFEELFTKLSETGNASVQELMALRETITALEEGAAAEQGQQIQITRSVASITEGQANLVVGHLQTISSTAQMILEAIQSAINNFVGAASGIPLTGGATFGPGSIVINAGPGASPQAISDQLQTDLRAKGVKV